MLIDRCTVFSELLETKRPSRHATMTTRTLSLELPPLHPAPHQLEEQEQEDEDYYSSSSGVKRRKNNISSSKNKYHHEEEEEGEEKDIHQHQAALPMPRNNHHHHHRQREQRILKEQEQPQQRKPRRKQLFEIRREEVERYQEEYYQLVGHHHQQIKEKIPVIALQRKTTFFGILLVICQLAYVDVHNLLPVGIIVYAIGIGLVVELLETTPDYGGEDDDGDVMTAMYWEEMGRQRRMEEERYFRLRQQHEQFRRDELHRIQELVEFEFHVLQGKPNVPRVVAREENGRLIYYTI